MNDGSGTVTIRQAGGPPAPAQASAAPPPAPTPSEQIVEDRNRVHYCTDPRGRTLGFRRLGVVEQLRMTEMVGAENARNEAYMGIASLVCMCCEIEGRRFGPPKNKLQLEARLAELDNDGYEAIAKAAA